MTESRDPARPIRTGTDGDSAKSSFMHTKTGRPESPVNPRQAQNLYVRGSADPAGPKPSELAPSNASGNPTDVGDGKKGRPS